MGEMVRHLVCHRGREQSFHEMQHHVAHRVDTAGAVEAVGVGDEAPALQGHARIALVEVVEVIPVGGGIAAIQQARLGEEITAGAHAADGGTQRVLRSQPGRDAGMCADDGVRIAPQGGDEDQIGAGNVGQTRLWRNDDATDHRQGQALFTGDQKAAAFGLAIADALDDIGGVNHLQRNRDAGGKGTLDRQQGHMFHRAP